MIILLVIQQFWEQFHLVRVVEKHFTDDNTRNGPDHKFSMNPTTWRKWLMRQKN